jgi:uroporphyrinogen decarboxylase
MSSLYLQENHLKLAEELVAEAHSNDGLAPLDLDRFYADQDVARADPFGREIPQCPLGIWMSGECVYDELGIEEDFWRYGHDEPWRMSLNKAYNDISEKVLGRRLLSEQKGDPNTSYPATKSLHDIFEAKNIWMSGSWWLTHSAEDSDSLVRLLDRVESRLHNLREYVLPDNWEAEKDRLMKLGIKPPLYRGQRGPVTFAMSVYGVEKLIFLILDKPDLAARFRDLILRTMLELARIKDEEAGYTPETAPRGFSFLDDNCAILSPDTYDFFGYPILKAVFDAYSPGPDDRRYQHSDSAMSHLLPILSRLNFSMVNFGPTVRVDEIRRLMPQTVIQGQLAPFTFSRNEEVNLVAEFLRDFEMVKESRGLLFATAGSINNGSRLTGLRLIMSAIQRHGRYA